MFLDSFSFFRLPDSFCLRHRWILKEKYDIVNYMKMLKPEVKFEDFEKIDVRVGTVIAAEKIEGSKKLIKLQVDFGDLGKRQIITGIAEWYKPEDFVDMQTTFVVNLPYRMLMGHESQGMIFACGLEDDKKPVFLLTKEKIENGEGVR